MRRGTEKRSLGGTLVLPLALVLAWAGSSGAQPVLDGALAGEVIEAHQRSRVRAAFDALAVADQARFLELLRGAESGLARELLLKALTTGNPVERIASFAEAIEGRPRAWLLENTQLCGCTGVRQQFSHTCQVTTLQALRGRYDPIYALEMRSGNADISRFDKRDATRLNPVLAAEQRELLESLYRGSVAGAREGTAKPRGEWQTGKRRYLDDLLNDLRRATGLAYETRRVVDPAAAVELLKAKLAQGMMTPLVLGERPGMFTHHILAVGMREGRGGVEFLVHDPWNAKSEWISERSIREARIQANQGSILRYLSYVEVPTRVVEGSSPPERALGPLERVLVERFLAEQPGVGAERAARILETFGDKTLELLERRPERLREVRGMSAEAAAAVGRAWVALPASSLAGLETPARAGAFGEAPPAGDLDVESEKLRAEAEQARRRSLGTRLLEWASRGNSARAVELRLARYRRADGTLRWSDLQLNGPKRVLGEVGGLAHFGLALFLKELATVAATGDRVRIEEFFDGLLTTDFYVHYGLFVAGARVSEVAYVRYLERYVRPRFVSGVLKTNLVLAAGLALPMIVEGKFEGRAFAITLGSLGLSTAAVRAGVAGIRWVSTLKSARETGALAQLGAGAGRLARVGGWFYTAAELAVILYVGEELEHRITQALDARAARRELLAARQRFLEAVADPAATPAGLAAAAEAYHGAENDYRAFLYRPLFADEEQLAQRIARIAARAKVEADKQRAAVARLRELPALRARAEREHGSVEAYAAQLTREREAALHAEVGRVFQSYERARSEHLDAVYTAERRPGALLAEAPSLERLLAPVADRSDLFATKQRERERAAFARALGRVAGNRLQTYEDERELVERSAEALRAAGRADAADALAAHLARIERLAAADRRLYAGGDAWDLSHEGVVERIRAASAGPGEE